MKLIDLWEYKTLNSVLHVVTNKSHTMTPPLHISNLIWSPQRKPVRSDLTLPLNLTSRGIEERKQHCAKGLSINVTGPGHEDGKYGGKGYWHYEWWVCVWGIEAMWKEIMLLHIRAKTEETLSRNDGQWLVWLVCEIWPQWLTCSPCQCPAVMCGEGMAPFKCMKASLTASIKKIKGDCSFVVLF